MLSDRQQGISEPLLAIADHAGGAWSELARAAMCELCRSVASEDTPIGVQLLQDIRRVFKERGGDRILSRDLADVLNDMDGRPWPEFNHGSGIRTDQLARLLKKYEIAPHGPMRRGDKNLRGYSRTSFEEAWSRYCVPENAVTGVTTVTTTIDTGD